jgi:hypothetical protein
LFPLLSKDWWQRVYAAKIHNLHSPDSPGNEAGPDQFAEVIEAGGN